MDKLIGTLGLQVLERTADKMVVRIIHDETRKAIDLSVELPIELDTSNTEKFVEQKIFEQKMPVFFVQSIMNYLRQASESPELIDAQVHTFTMKENNPNI